MKNLLFISLILSALLLSCGDDNTTNNNNNNGNNETLIYSLDSLSISGTGYQFNSIVSSLTNNSTDSLKLTFTIESNCIAADSGRTNISVGDTLGIYFYSFFNDTSQFNRVYTFYFRVSRNNTGFGASVQFLTQSTRFLRFRNIRLYKIS